MKEILLDPQLPAFIIFWTVGFSVGGDNLGENSYCLI